MIEKQQKTCMDTALGYLTARMRTDNEMQRYLQHKGFLQDDIDQAMLRLHELGLVDDAKFANELVREKSSLRPVGKRALAYSLRQKGVAQESIDLGLASYSDEDEARACSDLFAKLAKKHGLDRPGLAKIQRALAARGFGYDLISAAADRFKEEDGWE